jgi:hypothetical protein
MDSFLDIEATTMSEVVLPETQNLEAAAILIQNKVRRWLHCHSKSDMVKLSQTLNDLDAHIQLHYKAKFLIPHIKEIKTIQWGMRWKLLWLHIKQNTHLCIDPLERIKHQIWKRDAVNAWLIALQRHIDIIMPQRVKWLLENLDDNMVNESNKKELEKIIKKKKVEEIERIKAAIVAKENKVKLDK